jgi:hypothetical protein
MHHRENRHPRKSLADTTKLYSQVVARGSVVKIFNISALNKIRRYEYVSESPHEEGKEGRIEGVKFASVEHPSFVKG